MEENNLTPTRAEYSEEEDIKAIKEGRGVFLNQQQGSESIQIKLPNGAEIVLTSAFILPDQLCKLAVKLLGQIKQPEQNSQGNYIG